MGDSILKDSHQGDQRNGSGQQGGALDWKAGFLLSSHGKLDCIVWGKSKEEYKVDEWGSKIECYLVLSWRDQTRGTQEPHLGGLGSSSWKGQKVFGGGKERILEDTLRKSVHVVSLIDHKGHRGCQKPLEVLFRELPMFVYSFICHLTKNIWRYNIKSLKELSVW